MVQGTFNGFGERCGNADLSAVVPVLQLKMGRRCLTDEDLRKLTEVSRYIFEMANMNLRTNQPFVGPAAFAHKGGMHVSAVQRDRRTYEHIDPAAVGNTRRILISELAGTSNVRPLAEALQIDDRRTQRMLVEEVARLEAAGYQFESAEASFELLMRKRIGRYHPFFELLYYRTVVRHEEEGPVSEAIVKLRIDGRVEHQVAEGDGPVNALDRALRKALTPHFPVIDEVTLVDYKVRVINARAATAAKVCVVIESRDHERHWGTVGVSENIIDASWQALVDSIEYKLLTEEERAARQTASPSGRTRRRKKAAARPRKPKAKRKRS
jgi:2-isopropylmalate synthase